MIGIRKFDYVRYFRYLSKILRYRLNLIYKFRCIVYVCMMENVF